MQKITESTLKILEYLHTYRFLTPQQLLRLGVASHRNSIYRLLKELKTPKTPLIKALEFGVAVGRLPSLLYLTKDGAGLLAELWQVDLSDINYPKRKLFLSKEYLHRRTIIDFHIELRLWAERSGYEVPFFNADFDFTGNNRTKANPMRAKNRIELKKGYIIPDAVFMVQAEKKYLYVLEVHNGADSKRALRTLEQNFTALEEGGVSEQYNYEFAHRVLMVFEKAGCLKATLRRLKENALFERVGAYFLFKEVAQVQDNLFNDWIRLDNSKVGLF